MVKLRLFSTRARLGAVLLVLLMLLAGLMASLWPSLGLQSTQAQTKRGKMIKDARAALTEAMARWKASSTKENAIAVDKALADYNEAISGKKASVLSPSGLPPGPIQETEPNDTAATANPIDAAQGCVMVMGEVDPITDLDFFSFTAEAGSRVWAFVDTGGPQNPEAFSRDSVLTIFGPDQTTVIEMDDDDGTGNGCDSTQETIRASAIAGATLSDTGTYYLRIEDFDNDAVISPYTLFLVVTTSAETPETEPNDTTATANPLTSPLDIKSGSIGVAGDVDIYSFQANAGDLLFIAADGDPERDDIGTDLVVDLLAPDGSLIISADNSSSEGAPAPPAEAFCFLIQSAGTYFVRVTEFDAEATGSYHLMVRLCQAGEGGGGDCAITCPSDITQSADADQCGAVVNYPAPTTEGECTEVTCMPATGSFFPVGTTMVTCSTAEMASCSFNVTVQDTQSPTITCPENISVEGDAGGNPVIVDFPDPTTTDNCPGTTVLCSPASGSAFPVGMTTVNCTATDASGNMANCSFTVTVTAEPEQTFDICLQDDSSLDIFRFNTTTGDYLFMSCGPDGFTLSGTGAVTIRGCDIFLQDTGPDRRVRASVTTCQNRGNASISNIATDQSATVSDRDIENNTCSCPANGDGEERAGQ